MFSDLRARGGTLTIREFWRRTPKLPRTALILAVIAGILNAGSYVGLTIESASSGLTGIHAVILILGVTQLVRAGYERMLTGWRRGVRVDADPLPKWLIWSTVGAMLYMVGLIVGVAVAWGEGSAQIRDGREVWVVGNRVVRTLPPGSVDAFSAWSLRILSAAWLFFALLIASLGRGIEQRLRGRDAATRPASDRVAS